VLLAAAVPAAAKGPRGSRGNPIPLGQSAWLIDGSEDEWVTWEVKVTKVSPNAWPAIKAESDSNDPPKAGRTFFMARVVATYRGSKARESLSDGDLDAIGRSNVTYTTHADSCGVIPNELPSTYGSRGGSISGNICWSVRKTDVSSLHMYWEPLFRDRAIFWKLRK
jgi:hypothetical protein